MSAINQTLSSITESFTIALADRVRRLKAQGRAIIGLQTGDPDFPTPLPIVEAAYRALRDGQTHYSDSRGLPALRQAYAERIERQCGVSYDPTGEILATHGAIHAYHVGLAAVLNPDDAVLIPDPSWQSHANMVRVLHGRAVRVPSRPEDGFWPTMDAWESALTPRTRALVLCTPNNPTGQVAAPDYLAQVVDFAQKHDLFIISDEVYDHLLYDDARHHSVLSIPDAKARTLLVNSLSKTYAMTGWRVGYLAAPKSVLDQALKASQHTITNLAPFVQAAALYALTDAEMAHQAAAMVAEYARRRQQVLALDEALAPHPIGVTAPQGAFYFFLDVRALGLPSAEMAERLLEEADVALVPGSAYGRCGEGFLRMTIAAHPSDIEAGFRALVAWAKNALEAR